MSVVRRLLVLLVLAGVALVASPLASAHSELKSVTPADGTTLEAPPTEIVLTFTAKVLGDFTQVVLKGPDGAPVDLPAPVSKDDTVTQALPPLTGGTYSVVFRIVSEDSHPISGQSTFTVADAPNAPEGTTGSSPAAKAPSTSAAPTTSIPTTSAATSTAAGADTEPTSAEGGMGTLGATVILVLIAAALLAMFTWLARTRRRP